MARDVEYQVTGDDNSMPSLSSAERHFADSQKRIQKINEDSQKKIQADADRYSAKIGRTLETVIGRSAPKIAASLGSTFAEASSAAVPVLAGAAIAAAPLIGATLSAAVIGGAGAGGIIGGILLAAKDPRVNMAGAILAERLLGNLQKDAEPFIDPVLASMQRIGGEADLLRGRIQSIFKNSATFLPGLTTGVLRAVDGIVTGLDKIIAKAGPVMAQVGTTIGQVGQHAGKALELISGGSEESAAALRDLTNTLTFLIDTTAGTVRGLTEVYGFLNKIGAATGALGPFLDLMGKTGGEAELAAGQTARMAAATVQAGLAAQVAAGQVGTMTDKINNLTSAGRGLYDSTTQVADAIATLKGGLKENGKTLDENTAKGRANRTALSNLAGALNAQYNATVAVNGEGRKSNAVAGENREKFIQLARQLGLTKTQAGNLATQIGLIPAHPKSDFTLNTHDAVGRANAARDAIDRIHGKTVSIGVTIAQSQLRRVQNTLNRVGSGAFSAGGAVFAADRSSGTSRTDPPTPVNVAADVSVFLDGAPFYTITTTAVRARSDRDAWRRKVGQR